MLQKLRTMLWTWLVGPFRHRRTAAFWFLTAFALGGASSWLSNVETEKIAAVEGTGALPLGPAPSCDVIDVHDGETLKLDCAWDEAKPQIITVRLHCIHSPQLGQEPWGKLSRDHLRSIAALVVAMKPVGWDRHGQLVAILQSQHGELGLRMVADGFARVDPGHCRDERLLEAEADARTAKVGIWASAGSRQHR